MYIKKFIYSILLILPIVISSCNTCTEEMTAERSVKIQFAKISGKTYVDSTLDQLDIIINNGQTLSLYKDTSASKIELPLNQGSDTSIFYILTDSTSGFDTLKFYAKRNLELISPDCGFNTHFTNLRYKYSKVRIDTIEVNSLVITSDLNSLNFTIVLKADTTK